jgi:proline racemase
MSQPLSPAAQAVWKAFNEEEAGVFVDYGEKLAAALEAAVDKVVPEGCLARFSSDSEWQEGFTDANERIRCELLAIAAELEGRPVTTTETP